MNMRPAGGWTPDMYNYANSVDVYSIWADMVVYDKTYVDLNQRKYFAVYAGRRNGKNYIHTPEEIRERYRDQIVMDEDIPEIISGARSLRTTSSFGVPVEPDVWTVITGEASNHFSRKIYKSHKAGGQFSAPSATNRDISPAVYSFPCSSKRCRCRSNIIGYL